MKWVIECAIFNMWENTQMLSDLNKNRYWEFSRAVNAILKPKLKKLTQYM
jgi:hypothetical protein